MRENRSTLERAIREVVSEYVVSELYLMMKMRSQTQRVWPHRIPGGDNPCRGKKNCLKPRRQGRVSQ